MGGAVKLGIAAAIGYTIGGRVGVAAVNAVTETPALDTIKGAQWGGRIVVFLGVAYLLGK